jgi:hypothetical protein
MMSPAVGRPDRSYSQQPVDQRHAIARRRGEGGIGGERQEQRETQVKRARFRIAEDAEAEQKRQRRSIPELEQRPGDRHRIDQPPGLTCRLAPAGIGFGDKLLQVDIRRHRVRHSSSPVKTNGAGVPHLPRRALLEASREAGYLSQPFSL